jgi:SAM-dependent methyltransferase
MGTYILPHDLAGENRRLKLMSKLMDPLERRLIIQLGLRPHWKCLEVGCGNGSISRWLASRVIASGHVVASDIDPQYLDGVHPPNLEIRRVDVVHDPLETRTYDLVTARALLHHLPGSQQVLEKMVAALKPGGVLLCIEPDFLPATAAEPEVLHAFWKGWLDWSVTVGIDYFLGRNLPTIFAELKLEGVGAEGDTAIYNGGSDWATYWLETLQELGPRLLESGHLTSGLLSSFEKLYTDSRYWTSAITFVAAWGRKPVK